MATRKKTKPKNRSGGDESASNGLTACEVTVPLAPLRPELYAARHVEVRLDRDQAHTLKRLVEGLQTRGASQRDGKPIRSGGDALKYVLDGLVG